MWFVVAEGRSKQEANAMRHCGNGFGNYGDQLLSPRTCEKGKFKLWKPHLTFILNNGYLGEMKIMPTPNQERITWLHSHSFAGF